MTVLFVLIRIIVEMYTVFGVLFFLLTLPNPFAALTSSKTGDGR